MLTASTQRRATTNGKSGALATHLSSLTLAFAPLPLSLEAKQFYKFDAPLKVFETGVMATVDILAGDVLVIGSQNYTVRDVSTYPPAVYTKLILEQVIP